MIPEKEKKADKIEHKEKESSFAFFDIEHFIKRLFEQKRIFSLLIFVIRKQRLAMI